MFSILKIEKFRHIKSTVRKNPGLLLIGIDASKSSSTSCFYNIGKGILLKNYRVHHTHDGFHQFIEKIEQIRRNNKFCEVVVGVEPTGNYHKTLCEFLKSKGYCVVYVSSVVAKNNRKTIDNGRWGKNDPKDALNIADLLAQGKILFYRDEHSPFANIRNYLRLRQQLMKMITAMKNRIRNNIWACHFPELNAIFKNAADTVALRLIEQCPCAHDVASMDFVSFINLFKSSTNLKSKPKMRLADVWNAASTSVGIPALSSTRFEARLIACRMKQIQNEISLIDEQLRNFCAPKDEYQNLFTIPGFGLFTVCVFKAVIGDINAFSHARQLVKLAGLDIETMTSGKYIGRGKISKKGNSILRYAICQAVNVAVSKNKKIKQVFQAKLNALGNSKKAKANLKVKFADKFIRTAFALLKNNTPFDFNSFHVPVEDPVLTP